jgi:hypothetical protein
MHEMAITCSIVEIVSEASNNITNKSGGPDDPT